MHIPFVGGNQNEQVNEAENTRERRTYAGAVLRILGMKLVSPQMTSTVAASERWHSRPSAFSPLARKGSSARKMA